MIPIYPLHFLRTLHGPSRALRTLRSPSRALRTLRSRYDSPAVFLFLFGGIAGGVWGLALARALAESFPDSPTFDLAPTLLLASAAAAIGVALSWWLVERELVATDSGQSLNSHLVPLLLPVIYLGWPSVAPRLGWILLGGSVVVTALLWVSSLNVRMPFRWLVALSVVSITLGFYLRTLGPTVGRADTFEFQVVAPKLGVAHPTGYPLYILSGKLFSLLPLGSVAWRVNLTSAVFGALAAVAVYWLILELTARPLAAFCAALALAFSRVFWSQAVIAEVYALHNLFVAVILLLLVGGITGRWQFAVSRNRGRAGRRINPLHLLALLLGLSFANHLTTALLLPAVLTMVVFVRPRIGWKSWLGALGMLALGLSPYLYIFFRWPVLHDGVWMSASEFWQYITGQQFGGALQLDAWRTDPTRYEILGRLLREAFGWPGLILSAVGLGWLTRKSRRVASTTFFTFLAYAWYGLSYYVPDVSVFLLPAHLVLAVWLGAGLSAILEIPGAFGRRGERASPQSAWIWFYRYSFATLISLSALAPLYLMWTNFAFADQSGKSDAYVWGERVLDLLIPQGAAILADSVNIAPLYYLQQVEGRRPDLDIVVLADESTYRAELETRLAAGQSVYLARFLPGLEGVYHLRSLGPLIEVGLAPRTQPPPLDQELGVRFGPPSGSAATHTWNIELVGLSGPMPGPYGGTGLTLFWRVDGQVDEVYHVRLRLVGEDGRVWWQGEGRHAVNNYYPTPAWRSREVVADYHEIPPLTADPVVSPTGYTVQLGLFRPFSEDGLVIEGGEQWYSLPLVDLSIPMETPITNHPLRIRFAPLEDTSQRNSETGKGWRPAVEGLILNGVELPSVIAAGMPLDLSLHWSTVGSGTTSASTGANGHAEDPDAREWLVLTWVDDQGRRTRSAILEERGWTKLTVQSPATAGEYELRLGLMSPQGRSVQARCGWLAQSEEDCGLATLQVTDVLDTAQANFGGKMLLVDTRIDAPVSPSGSTLMVSPGQTIPLTLSWEALRPMGEDYTVSIQLIGPDGRLYGQTDTWPVQGTYPTSEWTPSQRIADPYRVTLAPDAPLGRHRLGVVVYLLATQTRLPLVEASGQVTGDVAWIAELEVVHK